MELITTHIWENHTLGYKQGFHRCKYGEFKHLGFAGREGEMPVLEQEQEIILGSLLENINVEASTRVFPGALALTLHCF